jgi:antirestriction factor ArdC-like protein
MTKTEMQAEALDRARNGQTWTNYPAIFSGFIEKGIPETDIRPRENVFTFNSWKALGRSVKKGEHGVKVVTFITVAGKVDVDQETGHVAGEFKTSNTYRRPHTTTVFHISQTEPTAERDLKHGLARGKRYSAYAGKQPHDYRAECDPGELAADRWNETH